MIPVCCLQCMWNLIGNIWNCKSGSIAVILLFVSLLRYIIFNTLEIILLFAGHCSLYLIKYRFSVWINLVIVPLTAKRKVFESKRKAHYNEYYAVKLARKLMNAEEDTEPAKEDGSSGRTSPELIFCGLEGCPGHRSGRTERCETAAAYRKNKVKDNGK